MYYSPSKQTDRQMNISTRINKPDQMDYAGLSDDMLDWYDANARTLPWRISPLESQGGISPIPYHIWLSEIMLQQTGVQAVIPYFEKFLHKWPTVEDLAAADLDQVLTAWAGLGYYARARNLHKCAIHIRDELNGIFPNTEEDLLKLPGVGTYTAAAIAAIAFQLPATVMDGNIERVMARMFNVHIPLPDAKPNLKEMAQKITPEHRPGDYAQAVMDLGATICTPRILKCTGRCPWEEACLGSKMGTADTLPLRKSKGAKPTRRGYAFWGEYQGHVWLRRRPEEGLLGGMMEVPSTPWQESKSWKDVPAPQVPIITNWKEMQGMVRHTFTHFHLELKIIKLDFAEKIDHQEGDWFALNRLEDFALPTVMTKIVDHVREPVLDL